MGTYIPSVSQIDANAEWPQPRWLKMRSRPCFNPVKWSTFMGVATAAPAERAIPNALKASVVNRIAFASLASRSRWGLHIKHYSLILPVNVEPILHVIVLAL